MKFVLNEIFNYHFGLLNQVEYAKIFQKLRRSSAAHVGDQPWLAENHRLKKSENQDSPLVLTAKLYKPSTLNIDFIQWHTQLIMCAVK